MNNIEDLNITVVGLGLIGGSIAKAIRKNLKVRNLWAVDLDINALSESKKSGIIDNCYVDPKYPLQNSEIVIMCTYPDTTLDFIKNNMIHFKQNALITDTSGIKGKIVTEVKKVMRDDLEFIGGHPMSGKETFGYQFSDDAIFLGANYILTPDESNTEDSVSFLKEILLKIGFKKIVETTPQMHDEIIAYTSQLPHVIASLLMTNSKFEKSIDCIGGSFKDITRVADINCDLWCQLLYENKKNILSELSVLINDINNICDIINNDDLHSLESIFKKSSILRKEINYEKA
ncbi:MAG: prephenate dehydrogenase [Sedimentibacter sp.]|uniref:prephenate dehydrogenase n=1 Tax=Sedimentibacter sp. TaxID=1960295 RepID=UPI00298271A0|nr:prephenate dehydrogenase [Sedimentibacter sp.]MDW5299718.1 prephenate dehydrogenase [Sedimentibacter sp.]